MADNEILFKLREKIFSGRDKERYMPIGYFVIWHSHVEMKITDLLQRVTKCRDASSFDLLTRGLDAKTKITRLRAAIATKKRKIGINLDARLRFFHDHITPLRNQICHSYITGDPQRPSIHFASISKLPFSAFGIQGDGSPPETINLLQLFEYGLWLNYLSDDLQKVLASEAHSETLEINNPRSPVLPPSLNNQKPQASRATPGRRQRKRARKWQPLRSSPKEQQ